MRQKIVTVTLLLGGLLMSPASAVAQDDSQDDSAEETDPVVEALEKEKKIAELEKAIAEAEKATLSAKLPDTEGSGIEGSVTFGEGSGYFAEMLAYRSLTEAAEEVTPLQAYSGGVEEAFSPARNSSGTARKRSSDSRSSR